MRVRDVTAPFPIHAITPRTGIPCGDLLTVEPIGNIDAERPSHRHTFSQVILIDAGSGSHLIDFIEVPVRPGTVHVLAPGQVHSWRVTGLRGQALMFSDDLLDGVGLLPDHLRELILLGAAPLSVTDDARERIQALYALIEHTPSAEAGRHLVTAVLWELVLGNTAPRSAPQHSSLSRAFTTLVLRAPSAGLTVAHCAALLGVTSGYLTECVVADTGSTPGHLIRTSVAREAQRLLSGTELTAAQIAVRLGFSEPSYFSRFFRRETGCTPTEYRRLPRSNQTSGQRISG